MGCSMSIGVDIGVGMSIGGPLGIGMGVATAAVAAAIIIMHFSAPHHGHIGTSPQEQPGGDAATAVRARALRLTPRPRAARNCNAHAAY